VGEGLDGVGMYFDEIRFLQALFDVRPHLDEPFSSTARRKLPNLTQMTLGGGLRHDAVEEISVPR
jgi:hypothetical protein